MKTNLTHRAVSNAKPREAEYLLTDGNGLYLRVLPSGTKSWLFRMTYKGNPYKHSLGQYPDVPLARARELTLQTRQDIALGKDLNSSTEKNPVLVDELFETWYRDYVEAVRTSKVNNESLKGRYLLHVKPKIGRSRLDSLKRGTILTSVLDPVVQQGSNRQANLILSELRQMFTYAAVREWVSGDPTAGISKKDVGGDEEPGERVLSEDELRVVKSVLCSSRRYTRSGFSGAIPFRSELAVWLALSTLARSIEIATVKAGDVDLESGIWRIPAEIAKNSMGHLVHLNEVSEKVFGILKAGNPEGYLFTGRRGGHICQKTFSKALKDRQRKGGGIKTRVSNPKLLLEGGPWTMHDLRRTGATMLGEMDFDADLIDLCLNHKEVKKMRRTYQKQQRLPARKEAFEALGAKLVEVLDGFDFLPSHEHLPLASRQR